MAACFVIASRLAMTKQEDFVFGSFALNRTCRYAHGLLIPEGAIQSGGKTLSVKRESKICALTLKLVIVRVWIATALRASQ
ncbi:MAG: hypothetical protein LBB55_01180 [Zoogloeaceae bacterium]|jgi:hypothetical protein|nr:hypothetical protein [Zoogloeaceae bacterium]